MSTSGGWIEVAGVEAPPDGTPDGYSGPRIPPRMCRLCWREHMVWRGGHWWLEHIGSFDTCLHSCHDGADFLGSTS